MPITVPRGPIELAADLHLPGDLDGAAPLRAVVLATPGGSVEEQIGADYASCLAARGIAALAFGPAHQGRSGGEPRDLEDPYRRGEDISYAIDALGTVPASIRTASASSASAPAAVARCTPPAPTTASGRSARSTPATSARRSAASSRTARRPLSTPWPVPVSGRPGPAC
jgi:fermentation-respiration switch protein FrsA (DUF1100 family)